MEAGAEWSGQALLPASCPNCGSPLSRAGACASCGAVARGFYRDLDLGSLDIARAVEQGLDYYLLLQLAPQASSAEVVAAYRSLRLLFPDDTARLVEHQRQRLELVEQAWYVLGDAGRRRRYDELRAQAHRQAAPVADEAARGLASFRAGQYDTAARLLRIAAGRAPGDAATQLAYALSLLYGAESLAAPEDWRVHEVEAALARAVAADASPGTQAQQALGQAVAAHDRATVMRDPARHAELLAEAGRLIAQAEALLPAWHLPPLVRAHWSLHARELGAALAWAERARRLAPDDALVARLRQMLRRNWELAPALLAQAAAQAAAILGDGTAPRLIESAWR